MRNSGFVSVIVLGLLLAACGDRPTEPEPGLDLDPLARTVTGDLFTSIRGDIGPGSSYEILVPVAWNGTLVLYAHGYVDPHDEGDVFNPMERDIFPLLPAMGYAVAYSTYSQKGLAVKDAMQRTKQLRGVFVTEVGEPTRTYLVGGSMGGLVAVGLAERFPKHYDGVLAACGMVGGTPAQIDYVANVRVLFDALFPGVLPGGLFDNTVLESDDVWALVAPAVGADLLSATALASVMNATFGTPIPGNSLPEFVGSLVTALTFDIRGFSNVLDLTQGRPPFDNTEVMYRGSPIPGHDAVINATVARHTAHPRAARYMKQYYEPSGRLEVPVLTLHNALDPLVPVLHEAWLEKAADAAGYSANLVQLPLGETYGHCAMDISEVLNAFGALVFWVEAGIPPTGP
jgi:pimeloyl-ACP methyl ester carboxylesterase